MNGGQEKQKQIKIILGFIQKAIETLSPCKNQFQGQFALVMNWKLM